MDRPPRPVPVADSLFAAVCDNATVGLFVMDDRQHCVYMNPAAVALTGYTLGEVQGRPLHEFVHHTHPDGRPFPIEDCPIDRAAPQNNQEQGEEVFVHKDGHFYPVAFTASPIRRDGAVVGTVIEVRHIGAERERHAQAQTVRELAERLLGEVRQEAIVQATTDTATRLTGAQFGAFFYNVIDPAGGHYMLYALSGVPREAFASFPMPRATQLFGPTFRGEGTIRLDDVLLDGRYGQEAPYHGMPPGHLPVRSYLAVPVRSDAGEVLGGLFFGHERPGMFSPAHAQLAEAVAAQAALGISRARLLAEAEDARDQARAEAEAKEQLYREATHANQMKDLFLATVSHELRTPLTSILGWSDMLATGLLPPDRWSEAVTVIARNARAQTQIVDDLLDISRIISGKLQLDVRPLLPEAVVQAAVESVRPAATARGVELRVDADGTSGTVLADADRLQQVLWNLLTNAVKFSERGGVVWLEVREAGSSVEFEVSDGGRGFPPEMEARLFERFSQADSSSRREHGGLGLGLAIVRELVQMHGGSVRATSPGPGLGARFVVCLPKAALAHAPGPPAAAVAQDPQAAPALASVDLSGCRILLVEDHVDSRMMLAGLLASHGAHVTQAGSVDEAVQALGPEWPDLLVSDIGMPGADGYDLIRTVRGREQADRRPPVPAVALTAYATAGDRERVLAAGFQRHVAKPVVPEALLDALASLWPGGHTAGEDATH